MEAASGTGQDELDLTDINVNNSVQAWFAQSPRIAGRRGENRFTFQPFSRNPECAIRMFPLPEATNMATRTRTNAKPGRRRNAAVSVRRRRTPEEARSETLIAARKLLLEEGPDAVTLQRLAAELGMTHSNLLHHFGSAGELQSALMAMMVRDLTAAVDGAISHLKSDAGAPRALIDMVFDAFDKGGAGKLAAWIAVSGNTEHLESITKAVNNLVQGIESKFARDSGDTHLGVTSAVLFLALMAFGDAVIGNALKDMLERERAAPRKIAAFLLPKFFERR
jgi:AcrR family transcriptional regulator